MMMTGMKMWDITIPTIGGIFIDMDRLVEGEREHFWTRACERFENGGVLDTSLIESTMPKHFDTFRKLVAYVDWYTPDDGPLLTVRGVLTKENVKEFSSGLKCRLRRIPWKMMRLMQIRTVPNHQIPQAAPAPAALTLRNRKRKLRKDQKVLRKVKRTRKLRRRARKLRTRKMIIRIRKRKRRMIEKRENHLIRRMEAAPGHRVDLVTWMKVKRTAFGRSRYMS